MPNGGRPLHRVWPEPPAPPVFRRCRSASSSCGGCRCRSHPQRSDYSRAPPLRQRQGCGLYVFVSRGSSSSLVSRATAKSAKPAELTVCSYQRVSPSPACTHPPPPPRAGGAAEGGGGQLEKLEKENVTLKAESVKLRRAREAGSVEVYSLFAQQQLAQLTSAKEKFKKKAAAGAAAERAGVEEELAAMRAELAAAQGELARLTGGELAAARAEAHEQLVRAAWFWRIAHPHERAGRRRTAPAPPRLPRRLSSQRYRQSQ